MESAFSRLELLIGSAAVNRLSDARVMVFGVGGVGGYVCEALARSGVGHFLLVDNDAVSLSNINRQIIATRRTVGRYKVDVMAERIADINPDASVEAKNLFFGEETQELFDWESYDYVVDAIDSVSSKVALILRAQKAGVPVISSMGAGNKLEANRFKVADIYDTSVCPLARVMRQQLRKRGVQSLKVVYSDEEPRTIPEAAEASAGKRVPGSTAFVPPAAGLLSAGEVVKDLIRLPLTSA